MIFCRLEATGLEEMEKQTETVRIMEGEQPLLAEYQGPYWGGDPEKQGKGRLPLLGLEDLNVYQVCTLY